MHVSLNSDATIDIMADPSLGLILCCFAAVVRADTVCSSQQRGFASAGNWYVVPLSLPHASLSISFEGNDEEI